MKINRSQPLVNQSYLLQKFPGKGGWVYAAIPEVLQNKNNPFGWVKVKGSIDGCAFKQYKLMPMGNGQLFLPVKAEIRKKIGKQEGDFVHITLYADDSTLEIPEEILDCFENEPKPILDTFLSLTESEKKAYLDWIYEAKTADKKAERILKMMTRLEQGLRFYD